MGTITITTAADEVGALNNIADVLVAMNESIIAAGKNNVVAMNEVKAAIVALDTSVKTLLVGKLNELVTQAATSADKLTTLDATFDHIHHDYHIQIAQNREVLMTSLTGGNAADALSRNNVNPPDDPY